MNMIRSFILLGLAGLMSLVASAQGNAGSVAGSGSARETASRMVEDGGTGKYKAVMVSDGSLPTHTVFRPKDLGAFGAKGRLPIVVWGNGACANSPWEHVNFLSEI